MNQNRESESWAVELIRQAKEGKRALKIGLAVSLAANVGLIAAVVAMATR